jgi:hypothetical protein
MSSPRAQIGSATLGNFVVRNSAGNGDNVKHTLLVNGVPAATGTPVAAGDSITVRVDMPPWIACKVGFLFDGQRTGRQRARALWRKRGRR